MAKRKHTSEWMLERIEEYLTGKGSYREIASANGISDKILKDWVHKYKEHGAEVFITGQGNKRYSKEYKTTCVEAVIRGEGSVDDIVARYNISAREVLRRWIQEHRGRFSVLTCQCDDAKIEWGEGKCREHKGKRAAPGSIMSYSVESISSRYLKMKRIMSVFFPC